MAATVTGQSLEALLNDLKNAWEPLTNDLSGPLILRGNTREESKDK